ncbi:MAG: 2,5-dichloro-2,5-cyclohexadiene-1,4-diol dehydrogenase LinX [Chlamydiae bacterium]|nr:2,5-dichloro-2,5-cyclohexadiene-1,4-diol dehydrogenase LinX [Chlamydiota bacterium]
MIFCFVKKEHQVSFKGKVVVVTGGNSGIGKAIAKEFIDKGAKVAIIGRNQETLKATEEELGCNCTSYQMDVTQVSEIDQGLLKIQKELGHFDSLILNAGIGRKVETKNTTEDDYDKIMDTNVKGPYFILQKSLPYLKEGSSVIAISSIAKTLGIASHGIYSASKAALNRLIIAFSAEFLESRKIRFNSISPGFTETPIFKDAIGKDPDFISKSSSIIPLKRMAEPEEIAQSTIFLASDQAKYICGVDLVVDGGLSTTYPINQLRDYYSNH